jgi:hypothetical protein
MGYFPEQEKEIAVIQFEKINIHKNWIFIIMIVE